MQIFNANRALHESSDKLNDNTLGITFRDGAFKILARYQSQNQNTHLYFNFDVCAFTQDDIVDDLDWFYFDTYGFCGVIVIDPWNFYYLKQILCEYIVTHWLHCTLCVLFGCYQYLLFKYVFDEHLLLFVYLLSSLIIILFNLVLAKIYIKSLNFRLCFLSIKKNSLCN